MNERLILLEGLPVLPRLAAAYAPARAQAPVLGLLALDARLAGIVRAASEPMLAQLRLAWWRDRLQADPATWPAREPVLSALAPFGAMHRAMAGLVDGWEAMLGEAPIDPACLARLAEARGHGFAALAMQLGAQAAQDEARRMGANWALADLAAGLSHPAERQAAREALALRDWRAGRLPRGLRTLAVLHGLAARAVKSGRDLDRLGLADLVPALRIGLLGR